MPGNQQFQILTQTPRLSHLHAPECVCHHSLDLWVALRESPFLLAGHWGQTSGHKPPTARRAKHNLLQPVNEARKFLSQKGSLKLPAGNASCRDPRVQEELAGSGLSQASSSILFPLQVLKRLSCCPSVDTRNKVPMSCKGVRSGDWWLSDQRSAPRNIKLR